MFHKRDNLAAIFLETILNKRYTIESAKINLSDTDKHIANCVLIVLDKIIEECQYEAVQYNSNNYLFFQD